MSTMSEENDLMSQEQNILITNRKLLSILYQQGKEMKDSAINFTKLQSIPQYRYYQDLKFHEEDLRNISSMYSDGEFHAPSLEYLLNQKLIRNASAIEKQKDDQQLLLNDLRKRVKRQQNLVNEAITESSFPVAESQIRLSEDEKIYEDWAGNQEIPKRWKHFLAHAETNHPSGSTLFIPFKPVYWETITQEEKDFANILDPSKGNDTQQKDQAPPQNLRLELEEFLSSIPWLNGLNERQINELQESLIILDHKDGDLIVKKGEKLAFTLIRKGKVGLYRGTDNRSGSRSEKVQTLYSGAVYGYHLDYHSDQTKNAAAAKAAYNYRAIGDDVVLFTWPIESVVAILHSKENQTAPEVINLYCTTGLMFENYRFTTRLEEDFLRFFHVDILHDLQTFYLKQQEALVAYNASTELKSPNRGNRSASPGRRRLNLLNARKPYEFQIEDMLKVLAISVPELDFKDMIDEWIIAVKQLFQIDRLGLYSLDRENNLMYLFTSEIVTTTATNTSGKNFSPTSNASESTLPRRDSDVTASSAGVGKPKMVTTIRMPLKGAAAHVAQNNKILNIEDCYKSEFFDSAMDVKAGYRTQQMLCIPIQNKQKQAIGVLQFINPNPSRTFKSEDEELASLVARLIAPYLLDLQKKAVNFALYRPIYHIEGNLQIQLHKLFTKLTNRHMKYTVRVVLGGKNLTPIKTSQQLLTVNMNGGKTTTSRSHGPDDYEDDENYSQSQAEGDGEEIPLNHCPINQVVDFNGLLIPALTPNCLVIFEFFSKNNHPTGWSALSLFHYNRYFRALPPPQSGETGRKIMTLPLIAGNCPEDWLLLLERFQLCQRYFYENHSLVTSNNADHTRNHLEVIQQIQPFALGVLEVEVLNQIATFYEDEQRIPFHPYSPPVISTGNSVITASTASHRHYVTVADWIMSLKSVPEVKRKNLSQQILPLVNYYLSTTKSSPCSNSAANSGSNNSGIILTNLIDQELKEFLWGCRENFLDHFPSYLPVFLMTVFDFTQRIHIKWLLIKLSSPIYTSSIAPSSASSTAGSTVVANFSLSAPLILSLLDSRIAFGKLRTYATSSLFSITSKMSLPHISHILALFIYLLKGEIYSDSSLSRYLYAVSSLYPESAGMNLFWLLQSNMIRSPLAEGYRGSIYLKELLLLVPSTYRQLLTNGWNLLQYLTIHIDWNSEEYFNPTQINTNELFNSYTIKDFYLPFISNEWKERLSNGTSTADLPRFSEVSSITPSFVFLQGGDDNYLQRYTLSCKTMQGRLEEYYFYPNYQMLESESCLQFILQTFNFIFHAQSSDFPPEFRCYSQDLYFTGLENTVIGKDLSVEHTSLSQLIAEYIKSKGKTPSNAIPTPKRGSGGSGGSNNNSGSEGNAITKIPEDLISNYIHETHGSQFDSFELQEIQSRFLYSLAAFLIAGFVLQVGGVNATNTYISEDGRLFFRNPIYFLGLDTYEMAGFSTNTPKRISPFFLPTFAEMIGGRNSAAFRNLQSITSKAFIILRKEATFLFFSVKSFLSSQQLSDEKIDIVLNSLKDSLRLHESDQSATSFMLDIFTKSLNADYQLKVKSPN